MNHRWICLFLALCLLVLPACQGPAEPIYEESVPGEWTQFEPSPKPASIGIRSVFSNAPSFSAQTTAECAVAHLRASVDGGLWFSCDTFDEPYFFMNDPWGHRNLTFALAETADLRSVRVQWYQGGGSAADVQTTYQREYLFRIEASADGEAWTQVYPTEGDPYAPSGTKGELESYPCSYEGANYVRLWCVGSDGGVAKDGATYFAVRNVNIVGIGHGEGGGEENRFNPAYLADQVKYTDPMSVNPAYAHLNLDVGEETTVYFVRHGKSDYTVSTNATEGLNSVGWKQAENIAEFLSLRKIDAVYSSPYQRCLDTVAPFLASNDLPLTVNEQFYERTIGSEVETAPAGFAAAQWEDYDYKLVGGESLNEVQARMMQGLSEVFSYARNNGQNTLVVSTHAAALSVLLDVYNGKGAENYSRILSMNTPCVRCVFRGPACVSMEFFDIAAF